MDTLDVPTRRGMVTVMILLISNIMIKLRADHLLLKRRKRIQETLGLRNVFKTTIIRWRTDEHLIKKITRLSPQKFNYLVHELSPYLQPMRDSTLYIQPEEMLLLFLLYVCHGSSLTSMACLLPIGQSTLSNVIAKVSKIICQRLNHWITMPETVEGWIEVENGFMERRGYPCCGAIDGKLVRIQKPPNTGSLCFNYKGFFSVNLLALVDSEMRFIYFDVCSQGSQSDAGIFRSCSLFNLLENNMLGFPLARKLPNSNVIMPSHILGDGAFPLSLYLMKPFGGKFLSTELSKYNRMVCRSRTIVESSFGNLANRFRIFRRCLDTSLEVSVDIIHACLILSNVNLGHRKPIPIDLSSIRFYRTPFNSANSMRDHLIAYANM